MASEHTTPRVTVVTPAFNVAPYLAEAITSVLAQSMRDFELLVVDDGSTDESLQIARRFAEADHRVRVIAIEHGGLSAARDAGVNAARGDWIAFLDGDDVWEDEFLGRQLGLVESQPESCVGSFCWSRGIDQNGGPRRLAHVPDPGTYDLKKMLLGICPPGNGSCLLIRRRTLFETGPFHPTMVSGQDIEMWYRMLQASPARHFVCLPEVLVRYRERPGSLTSTRLKDRMAAKVWMLPMYVTSLSRREKFAVFIQFARLAERKGSRKHLRHWSVQAAKCAPHRLLTSTHGLFALAVVLLGTRTAQTLQESILSFMERLDGHTRLDRPKQPPRKYRDANSRSRWISFWFQLAGRDAAQSTAVLRLGETRSRTPPPEIAGPAIVVTTHPATVEAIGQFLDKSFDVVVAAPEMEGLTPGCVEIFARNAARIARSRVALSLPARRNWAHRISRFVDINDDYPCPLRPGHRFFECTPKELAQVS
jgi:glycosyltransferase involved in cell wall biosynthesis